MKNLSSTRSFLLALCFSLFGTAFLSAATFTVTSTVDGAPGSLRDAVASSVAGDNIIFDAATDGIPQTLTLGEIAINQSITIVGNGPTNTLISGGNNGRIFNITAGPVDISALMMANGVDNNGGAIYLDGVALSLTDVVFEENEATGNAPNQGGGAIFNDGGDLVLVDVNFFNNEATGTNGSGGAIFNDTGGLLRAKRGTFSGNTAQRAGGALEDASGASTTVFLQGVTMEQNLALATPGNGGAIHLSGNSNITMIFCTFSGNYADNEGGALWNGTGTMIVARNTLVENNRAAGPAADNGGGGIFNAGGLLRVRRSTVNANFADGAAGSGGGIFNDAGGTLDVFLTTISNNFATRAGGGIEDNSGTGGGLTMQQATVSTNSTGNSPGNGGGLHITGPGNSTLGNSVFTDNEAAAEGGGLWNGTGTMIANNLTVTLNVASGAAADQGGGGYFNAGGTLSIRGGSISGNSADGAAGSGGGILNDAGGALVILSSNIFSNTAVRAGGGIEDNSGAGTTINIEDTSVESNMTGGSPGNGGGLHITGDGNITVENCTFNSNSAASEGGGLWNGTGIMDIKGTQIGDNQALGAAADNGGGGVFNAGGTVRITNSQLLGNNAAGTAGSGGGIFNDAGGSLKVIGSSITQNNAMRAGGGIEDNSGTGTVVNLVDVELNDNNANGAPGNGGGLHVTGPGGVVLTNGTVNNNNAALEGGGLWNGTGTMEINGTAIQGNFAFGNAADEGGGGIFNAGGTVITRNVNIAANGAVGGAGSGGGIFNDVGGMLDLNNTTIASNVSSRAGGGIEDNSGASTNIQLVSVTLTSNTTGSTPGNGGGLHITGPGDATLTNCNVNSNAAVAEGGGLWNGTGTMTVGNTTIVGNIAAGAPADQGGGGVFNAGGTVVINGGSISQNQATGAAGSGGGIFNDAGGTLDLNGTLIQANSAVRAGGGIEDNSGAGLTVFLRNVNLDGNVTGGAPGNGGGLHVTGPGDVEIRGGVVSSNTAASEGGGLWNGTGLMQVVDVSVFGNAANGDAADEGGGGIFNNGGTVSVRESDIRNNTALGVNGSGGGIFNANGGTVRTFRTNIFTNRASRAGGGIEDASGPFGSLLVRLTIIESNDAGSNPGNGGGVHMTGGGLSRFDESEIHFNVAASEGGGLWNSNGRMNINNSTIDTNDALGTDPTEGGGGIFNAGGIVNLNTSTVSTNTSASVGGGIANDGGTVNTISGTIVFNEAVGGGGLAQSGGSTNFNNTVLAQNTATLIGNDLGIAGGTIVSNDYNFIGEDDLTGSFAAVAQANDQVGTVATPLNANLDPTLANNGGFTFTHALLCPSDLVDLGDPTIVTADQRGFPVVGGRRDIGSIESQTGCPEPFTHDHHHTFETSTQVLNSSIYPNPVLNGRATVQIPADFGEDVTLRLLDLSGAVLRERQTTFGTEEIDFSDLPRGTYLLQVITPATTESHRVIVGK